jgi:hypothetical protein
MAKATDNFGDSFDNDVVQTKPAAFDTRKCNDSAWNAIGSKLKLPGKPPLGKEARAKKV